MIEIEAPDGTVLEFPDGMSDDQILAVMQREYGAPKQNNNPEIDPKVIAELQAAPEQQQFTQPRSTIADDVTNKAMQGLSFGWGDEIAKHTVNALGGDGQATQDDINQSGQRLSDIDPRLGYAGSAVEMLGGGVTGGYGAAKAFGSQLLSKAPAWTKLAGIGATEGGLSAAGHATENKGDAAVTGGTIGGMTGIILPQAGRIAGDKVKQVMQSKAVNNVKDSLTNKAKNLGFVVPPTHANPTVLNRVTEGISGKLMTQQAASAKNQSVTNKLAKQALGIPEDGLLTEQTLKTIRSDAGEAYNKLSNIKEIRADGAYNRSLDFIADDYNKFISEFPELANPEIDNLIKALGKKSFSGKGANELLKKLRFDANSNMANLDPAKKALGKAQKEASTIVEEMIDRHLQGSGQSGLLNELKQARQTIAKTYSVEDAFNPATGNINAQRLAKQLSKKKPLSGELKEIGEFAQAYPKAAQELTSSAPGLSPLTLGFGATGAAMDSGVMLGLAAGRPLMRSMILSKPYQNMMTQPTYNMLLPRAGQLLGSPAAVGIASEKAGLLTH